MEIPVNSPLLNTERAAQVLGDIQPFTLKRWRTRGRGPKFLKMGGKVFYRECDLREFLDAAIVDPAAAATARKRARRRHPR